MVRKARHPGLPLALWDQGIRVGPPPRPNRAVHPYQGTIHFQGLLINVENLAGSTRRGTGPDGKPWSTRMRHHYGEIAGTRGSDGNPIDCFVGPNPIAPTAYVVHQKQLHEGDQHTPVGTYDEDKVMLGFSSRGAALNAYRKHYDVPTLNPGISEIDVAELRRRCENGEMMFGAALMKGNWEYRKTPPADRTGWEPPAGRRRTWRRRKGQAGPQVAAAPEPVPVQHALSREPVAPAPVQQPVAPLPEPQAPVEEEAPAPKPKAAEPEPKPRAKKEEEPKGKRSAAEDTESAAETSAEEEEPDPQAQFTEDVLGHLAWMRKEKGRLNPDERQALWSVAQGCCADGEEPPPLNQVRPQKLSGPPEMDDDTRDKLGTLLADAHEKFPDAQGMVEDLMGTLVGAEPLHDEGEVAHYDPEHHDHQQGHEFYDPQEGQDAVTATTTGHHIPGGPVLVRAKTRKPTLEEDPSQVPPQTHGPTAVFEDSDAPPGTRLHDLENGVYHMTELHDVWGERGDAKMIGVDMPREHQNDLLRELWPQIKSHARKAISNKYKKLEYNDQNLRDLEQAAAIGVLRGLYRYRGGFAFMRNSRGIIDYEIMKRAMSQGNMPDIPKSKLDQMRAINAAAMRASQVYGIDVDELQPDQIAEHWNITKRQEYGRDLDRYASDGAEIIDQNKEQLPLERWRPLDEMGNERKGTKTRPGKLALIKEIDDLRRGRHMHDSFWMDEHPEQLMDIEAPGMSAAAKEELISESQEILAAMPEDQARILWDWKVLGHTQKQQAEAMGGFTDVPFPTLKRKMKRLREAAARAFTMEAARRGNNEGEIKALYQHTSNWKEAEAAVAKERGEEEAEAAEPAKHPDHIFGPSQRELEEQYGSAEHAKMIMDARALNERAHQRMKQVIKRINSGTDTEADRIFVEKVQSQAEERFREAQRPVFRTQDAHEPTWSGPHSPFDKKDPVGHVMEQLREENPDVTPEEAAQAYVEKRRADYPTHRRHTAERHRSRLIEHFNVALDKTTDPQAREVIKQALREEMEAGGISEERVAQMTEGARKRTAPPKLEDAGTWQELHDAVMKEKPKDVDPFWFYLAATEGASARDAARAMANKRPEPLRSRLTGLLHDPNWHNTPLPEINDETTSVEVHRSDRTGEITGYTLHWRASDNPDVYPGTVKVRRPELWMAQEEMAARRDDMQWSQKMSKYIRAGNEGRWTPQAPESAVWNYRRGEIESTVQSQEAEREASGRGEDVQRAPEESAEKSLRPSYPKPNYRGPRLVLHVSSA